MLELFRGCIPRLPLLPGGVRLPPCTGAQPGTACPQGIEACQDSGYQDMTLMSLSSSDYPDLLPSVTDSWSGCEPHKVNLALPPLRADNFSMQLMEKLQRGGRKSGLTFAPEAGSQRLRDAINKNVTEEDLLNSCRTAFAGGWEQREALLHAGPAHRDRRRCAGHRRPGQQSLPRLAEQHPQPFSRRADHGLHLLLCAQIPHPLPVGGAEYPGGVFAER